MRRVAFSVLAILIVGVLGVSSAKPQKASGVPPWLPIPLLPPLGPFVHFVFVGACNYQLVGVTRDTAKQVNVDIPDVLAQTLGDHDVQDHRALLQFNGSIVTTSANLQKCSSSKKTPSSDNCLLYDLARKKLTTDLPSVGGVHLVDTFGAYVLKMKDVDPSLTHLANPPFATLGLSAGWLWATPSEYQCSVTTAGQKKTYHREVIMSVALDPSKSSFVINAESDALTFNYSGKDQIWIRVLSVPSREACLTKPGRHHWKTDEDFALNYLVGSPEPKEWYVPKYEGSNGKPGKPIPFCKAATELSNLLLNFRAMSEKGASKTSNVDGSRINMLLSSMGSDCIGANWEQ